MTNYRSFVGPENLYDVMGGLQFVVLYELGLREEHTLLDIGCGSLRAGRLFIPYLNSNKYFGVEPNEEMLLEGLEHEVGLILTHSKFPTFFHVDNFNFHFDGHAPSTGFDYLLAQSIFSHATRKQVRTCMHNAAEVMHKDSIFVATYFNATNGDGADDPIEWIYPSVVKYPYLLMKDYANKAGLSFEILDKHHPVGQTWILLRKTQ